MGIIISANYDHDVCVWVGVYVHVWYVAGCLGACVPLIRMT